MLADRSALKTELLDAFAERILVNTTPDAADLGLAHADFTWSAAADDAAFRLRIPNVLCFPRGALSLVVGPTGAGKTAVLMTLLGEMHRLPHGSDADTMVGLPRGGGVAYAAQESWVQNETIRVRQFTTPQWGVNVQHS